MDLFAHSESDWTGAIALPQAIAKFYREVGPDNIAIAGSGNPFHIPSLARLWNYQAGYRWNGITGEPAAGWNPEWIAVADVSDAVFIFSDDRGEILFAMHGGNAWNPVQLFPDVNSMAACLGAVGSIIADAGVDFLDDNCQVRSSHKLTALARLVALIGSQSHAETIWQCVGF